MFVREAMAMEIDRAHRQSAYPVRFEWGPTGAAATAGARRTPWWSTCCRSPRPCAWASSAGSPCIPLPGRTRRAAGVRRTRVGATLAIGRHEARRLGGGPSLSPASIVAAEGVVSRLVLPSPERLRRSPPPLGGGQVAAADGGRGLPAQPTAVARHPVIGAPRSGCAITVIAAGERWPDGSLRPAVEDLWGAGAVLAALVDLGVDGLSPEAARRGGGVPRRRADDLAAAVNACASGRELVDGGFADDVAIASELDVADRVPVLADGAFTRPLDSPIGQGRPRHPARPVDGVASG